MEQLDMGNISLNVRKNDRKKETDIENRIV
jgi:hypothetical protein